MSRHTFEYRVVYQEANGFAIYKLSVDEKGNYYFVGRTPHSPWGLSLESLKQETQEIELAFRKPVIDYKTILVI